MKKGIIIVIILGMLGWAIFDFISSKSTTNEPNMDNAPIEDKQADEREIGLEVGNQAPDFELQTLDGEPAKLSDYRGSRVMLNFWATWCPPCRAEMPDMEKFHQDTDITILAVNLTETESNMQQIEDFTQEYGLTFPILLDEHIEVASLYMIQPIPTTYMIDSNGVIHYKALGAMNYQLMVNEFEKMD